MDNVNRKCESKYECRCNSCINFSELKYDTIQYFHNFINNYKNMKMHKV